MQVLRSSKIIMKTKSRSIKTEALVTTNLAHPVLLSWHDLIRLKVIDENFPQSANSVTTTIVAPKQVLSDKGRSTKSSVQLEKHPQNR